jgi:hypothetical protein
VIELPNETMSYVTLRFHWYDNHVIVLKLQRVAEHTHINDRRHTFTRNLSACEFPKHQIYGLLRYFNLEGRRKYTFKSTIWKENLHEISKDNGVRVVNLDA